VKFTISVAAEIASHKRCQMIRNDKQAVSKLSRGQSQYNNNLQLYLPTPAI